MHLTCFPIQNSGARNQSAHLRRACICICLEYLVYLGTCASGVPSCAPTLRAPRSVPTRRSGTLGASPGRAILCEGGIPLSVGHFQTPSQSSTLPRLCRLQSSQHLCLQHPLHLHPLAPNSIMWLVTLVCDWRRAGQSRTIRRWYWPSLFYRG